MPDHIRYVDLHAGNDSTGDGSTGVPWKTIAKATTGSGLSLLSGDTYAIKVRTAGVVRYNDQVDLDGDLSVAGATVIVEPDDGQPDYLLDAIKAIVIRAAHTAGTLIVRGMNWIGSMDALMWYAADHAEHVIIERSTLVCDGVTNMKILDVGSSNHSGTITFREVECSGSTTFIRAKNCGGLTIEHCHITTGSAQPGFKILDLGNAGGVLGDITITDTAWAVTLSDNQGFLDITPAIQNADATWTISRNVFEVSGSALTGLLMWFQGPDTTSTHELNLAITHNRITTDSTGRVIRIGDHSTDTRRYRLAYELPGHWGAVTVTDNIILNAGGADDSGPTLLIGNGVDGAEVARNFLRGGQTYAWGFEIIANDCQVHHNVSVGYWPLMVYGDRATVHHNTLYATSGNALATAAPLGLEWEPSTGCVVHHNLLVSMDDSATRGCYADAAADYGDTWLFNHYLYANCLWPGASASIAVLGAASTSCATLAAYRDFMRTGTTDGSGDTPFCRTHPDNGQDSISADPGFPDVTADDRHGFRPANVAMWLPDGDYCGALPPTRPACAEERWTLDGDDWSVA